MGGMVCEDDSGGAPRGVEARVASEFTDAEFLGAAGGKGIRDRDAAAKPD